jgi:predicted transcriptional regulator
VIQENNVLLLPIRKPYSRLIMVGKKRFELRKRLPKHDCKYVFIYETSPTKAIIGYFEVSRIHTGSISKIWEITKGGSFVTKEYFEEYYKKSSYGVAFEIKESKKLEKPLSLSDLGIGHPPQDFMYIKNIDLCESVMR